MKKVWPAVLYLLILCSCGKETDRAEAMQEQYKNLASYETDVRVSVPREDETLVYALHLSTQGDAVRATVSEPEELMGVGAVLEGDKLTLTFDDLVLDVGTLSPRVSALSCVPLVLQNFPKVYLDSSGAETIGDVDALRADFSLTLSGETFAWLALGSTPPARRCTPRSRKMTKLLPRRSLRILFLVIYYRRTRRSSARRN